MEQSDRYTDFQRYLAAKKSVDDRALNDHVWQSLYQQLRHAHPQPAHPQATKPLRVIEIGGGIGTMVERILERGLLTQAHYILVDEVAENIFTIRQRLPQWAVGAGFDVSVTDDVGAMLQISRPATKHRAATQLTIELIEADCFDFAACAAYQQRADLLIAHALLDLFDIARALPKLTVLLKPQALFYATVNFDGNTILQPEIDRDYDDQIEAAYHATMDARITDGLPSGDSRSGRHLFGHLRDAGLTILDAGSSDWVVFANQHGYPADEAYFLHFIVQTMYRALHQSADLDPRRFAEWIEIRHAQIERGELVYIAHQLDFLAQVT